MSVADIDRLEATTGVSGQSAECVRYAGAGDAFMNDVNPDAYWVGAAQDTRGKTLAFLSRVLSAGLVALAGAGRLMGNGFAAWSYLLWFLALMMGEDIGSRSTCCELVTSMCGVCPEACQYSVEFESRSGLRGRVDELARRTPRGRGREPRASLGSGVVSHRTRPGVVLQPLHDRRRFKNAVFIAPKQRLDHHLPDTLEGIPARSPIPVLLRLRGLRPTLSCSYRSKIFPCGRLRILPIHTLAPQPVNLLVGHHPHRRPLPKGSDSDNYTDKPAVLVIVEWQNGCR